MYYYIVENASRQEFEKIELKVKETLTNFDILGEFAYIDSLADVADAVKTGIDKGFSTIVAVGDDELLEKIAVCVIDTKAAVGLLPLEEGIMSNALGVGNWKSACEILAARRILLMDVGVVNNKFFISKVLANSSPDIAPQIKSKSIISKLLSSKPKISEEQLTPLNIQIEDGYQIDSQIAGLLITNLRPFGKDIESVRQSMIDTTLHIAFSAQIESGDVYNNLNDNPKLLEDNKISLFHADKFSIRSEKPLFFWEHNEVIARTPADFTVLPQTLKIISGRLR